MINNAPRCHNPTNPPQPHSDTTSPQHDTPGPGWRTTTLHGGPLHGQNAHIHRHGQEPPTITLAHGGTHWPTHWTTYHRHPNGTYHWHGE